MNKPKQQPKQLPLQLTLKDGRELSVRWYGKYQVPYSTRLALCIEFTTTVDIVEGHDTFRLEVNKDNTLEVYATTLSDFYVCDNVTHYFKASDLKRLQLRGTFEATTIQAAYDEWLEREEAEDL